MNYWNQVQLTGKDAADAGQKALDALKNGNTAQAIDALYLSQYIEKPFAESSKLWSVLYETAKTMPGT